jgi:hypothetical protein
LLPTISMLTLIMHQMVNECSMMCHMSSFSWYKFWWLTYHFGPRVLRFRVMY